MNDTVTEKASELIEVLKACDAEPGACYQCPYGGKPTHDEGCAKLNADAAALIHVLMVDRKDLRNELCLHCGKYHNAHKGACKGCRWE